MAIKQDAICNYLDIVDLVPQLYDDEDQNFPVLSPEQIRELVIRNDAQLRAELRPYYGDSLSTTSPYAVTPVARFGNSANGKLLITNGTNDIAVSTLNCVFLLFSLKVKSVPTTPKNQLFGISILNP